ncbi:MAG: response regulator [Chloroflexota bacterium]
MTRILVVDDDEAVLALLKEALPMLGFKADFASSGNEAVNLIETEEYELILSDVRMPEMNGIEVATAAFKSSADIPVLFMSGNPNVQVEERSFLAKPFTITQLETKLAFMLNNNSSDE